MSNWISTEDSLPKNKRLVMVTNGFDIASAWYDKRASDFTCFDGEFAITLADTTHWKEMISLPEEMPSHA